MEIPQLIIGVIIFLAFVLSLIGFKNKYPNRDE